eukprot:1674711-Rhodomonas_salina.1
MEAQGVDTVSIKETPGTEYVLVDLLRSWKLPESVVGKISDRWKCQIAPFATDEADLNQHVLDGTPVLTPSRFGERACSSVGEDCLEYLIDNPYATFLFRVHGWSMVLEANRERNTFPKPKIAFVAGWGRPGDQVDRLVPNVVLPCVASAPSPLSLSSCISAGSILIDDEELRIVIADSQSFSIGRCRRSSADRKGNCAFRATWQPESAPSKHSREHVPLPVAPCRSILTADLSAQRRKVVASRRRRGVSAPEVRGKHQENPVLLGPSGKPVVKLFVFAARNAYDILQRVEQDASLQPPRPLQFSFARSSGAERRLRPSADAVGRTSGGGRAAAAVAAERAASRAHAAALRHGRRARHPQALSGRGEPRASEQESSCVEKCLAVSMCWEGLDELRGRVQYPLSTFRAQRIRANGHLGSAPLIDFVVAAEARQELCPADGHRGTADRLEKDMGSDGNISGENDVADGDRVMDRRSRATERGVTEKDKAVS